MTDRGGKRKGAGRKDRPDERKVPIVIKLPTECVPAECAAVIDNRGTLFLELCIECRELKKPAEMMNRQPYCRGCY